MNYLRSLSLPSLAGHTMLPAEELNHHLANVFCNRWTLLVCKLLIGLVSAYDIYLTIKYVQYLGEMELNPIGRWLMNLDQGPTCELQQVAGFITAKFAGNFIAISVIELLASWKRHLATAVALPIVLFQLWLLQFLLYGTN